MTLWDAVIAATRAVDWSSVGVSGGIPTTRTQAGSTIAAYDGAATTINNAIAAAADDTYVLLGEGTFNLTSRVHFGKNNVTLRGAGADKTKLVFADTSGSGGILACVVNLGTADTSWWLGGPANTGTWTASSYARGQTTITMTLTAGSWPTVGVPMCLDQTEDSSAPEAGVYCNVWGLPGSCRSGRGQQQTVVVTNVTGSGSTREVTFTPGLYMPNWTADKSPGAFWVSNARSRCGVENLSLDMSAVAYAENTVIGMPGAVDCWVKGVRTIHPGRSHVWPYVAARCTIRDSYCYEHYRDHSSTSSVSYGPEIFASGDILVENNIFHQLNASFAFNGGCEGSVFAYNYCVPTAVSNNIGMWYGLWLHSLLNFILLEGNDTQGINLDAIHGSHNFITMYRNYCSGYVASGSNRHALNLDDTSRYSNVLGNVLGVVGGATAYEGDSGYASDRTIYGISTDAVTGDSLYRWGNYDTVNTATRWENSEVPTGEATYPQTVPSDHTLPNSLYLSGKPSWFGNRPWPIIGPDVTGSTDIADLGGHVYKIPARVAYESMSVDPAGDGTMLEFDADALYASTPTPPTGTITLAVR